MRENPEIFLESYQQCTQKDSVCTTLALLGISSNRMSFLEHSKYSRPHIWRTRNTTQERETAASKSGVFHYHLHTSCEGHYLGQDWFEGNSGRLLGKRGSLSKSHRQGIDITFNFLRFQKQTNRKIGAKPSCTCH